jgi:hypothetical protein
MCSGSITRRPAVSASCADERRRWNALTREDELRLGDIDARQPATLGQDTRRLAPSPAPELEHIRSWWLQGEDLSRYGIRGDPTTSVCHSSNRTAIAL